MSAYGIGVFLLIKRLKVSYPDITQPWYEYYAGALVIFDNIELYFNSLKLFVPGCGYHPKTSKIIIVMHLDNLTSSK